MYGACVEAGDVARGVRNISAANEAAQHRSVQPHLESGEEVVILTQVWPKGGKWSTLWQPRFQVTPAGPAVPKPSVVAVSSRRFLVVSHTTGGDDASTLLFSGALDDVRSVQLARALGQHELSWEADARRYTLWVNKPYAKQVAQALQRGATSQGS